MLSVALLKRVSAAEQHNAPHRTRRVHQYLQET
jgi:hypothetical protein